LHKTEVSLPATSLFADGYLQDGYLQRIICE